MLPARYRRFVAWISPVAVIGPKWHVLLSYPQPSMQLQIDPCRRIVIYRGPFKVPRLFGEGHILKPESSVNTPPTNYLPIYLYACVTSTTYPRPHAACCRPPVIHKRLTTRKFLGPSDKFYLGYNRSVTKSHEPESKPYALAKQASSKWWSVGYRGID